MRKHLTGVVIAACAASCTLAYPLVVAVEAEHTTTSPTMPTTTAAATTTANQTAAASSVQLSDSLEPSTALPSTSTVSSTPSSTDAITLHAEPAPMATAAGAVPQSVIRRVLPADREQTVQFNDTLWRNYVDTTNAYHGDDRIQEYWATSPAMNNREIPLVVIRARDENRPTLYLLNGAGGGEETVTWPTNTSVLDFYWKKNINVVIPMRGAYSYYVDWLEEPPGTGKYLKGPQKWETFLTRELPQVLETEILHADTSKRGIVGLSMSATSSLLLAERNGDFYSVVGSYSGCASTSRLLPSMFAKLTVERDDATPAMIWGPLGSETNLAHDALVQAEGLRGKTVYISNGSGFVGDTEMYSALLNGNRQSSEAFDSSSNVLIGGGAIEAATNSCTHDLQVKLARLDIPATFNFRNHGVHTWQYWEQDMKDSWPVYAKGFGIADEQPTIGSRAAETPLVVPEEKLHQLPYETQQ
ncbi:alpha/beta hydrolase family protein [Corynebacterium sp. HS2168-gen11]|uniref:alpha/beta hydrolase n=1 Tax=Corynebacterium sp. HS2168-gen11 TaxID=2974027 RepID=UPI00216AB821|nr:alpha/beta hydrolase family protein [Corynebacterium sp. HS2168-gen11]MCS4534849.1 esterase family protein [Corynebacterium sp. HS2168-gen11]